MYVDNELDNNLDMYDDYEAFPYCLEYDIEEDIKYLYENPNISNEVAENILQHCEKNLEIIIDDGEINDELLEYIKIEILAYRLLKLDICSKNIAYHILECRILEAYDKQYIQRDYFEEMMLMVLSIIPDFEMVFYFGEWRCFLNDCISMAKYRQFLKKCNFNRAYDLFKRIIENLIINEKCYIGEEIDENKILEHNMWIKGKFETFLSVAIATDKLDDLQEQVNILFKNNDIISLSKIDIEEMQIRIDVEKFFNNNINKYNIDDVKGFINYFEKLDLFNDNNCNKNRIKTMFLYVDVLEKIVMQTYYEEDKLNYKSLYNKIIDICNTLNEIMEEKNFILQLIQLIMERILENVMTSKKCQTYFCAYINQNY